MVLSLNLTEITFQNNISSSHFQQKNKTQYTVYMYCSSTLLAVWNWESVVKFFEKTKSDIYLDCMLIFGQPPMVQIIGWR